MSTFYPTSSGQVDVLSNSYVQDQKFISYSESPMIHGNMMMYLPGVPSNGPFSEVVQNPVHIPSMSGRNEMMFIPPTNDHISGAQSNTLVDGERNLNGLSLSLSTQLSTGVHQPASFDQFSNAGMSPLGMADGAFQNSMRFGAPNNLQDLVDLKPVGYNVNQYEQAGNGRVITKSRFLIVTQQLLDEIVHVQEAFKQHESGKDQTVKKVEDGTSDSNEKSVVASDINETASASCPELSGSERQDLQNKLERLLAMLDEVDRRYKQYHHQMQILVSSFDYIAGSGAAKPYTTLASKTISRHFRSLRDGISGQIQSTRKTLGEQDSGQGGVIRRLRYVDQQLRQQRALQQFGMMRHSWRPQRGLPENAVTALRAWLFEHFLHPYPKDSEKIMLARQTGLTRSQVGNWFINARVRLWKPMVEEMYNEEFGEADLNLKSSPCRTSEDRREELQERIRSMADQSGGHDESKINVKDHTYEMNQTKLHDNQPSTSHGFYPHDQNGLIPFQVAELGSYGVNPNQVSLALGLRQIEGDVGTSLRPGSSSENAVGAGTAEYTYFGQVNQLQAHKFGNSNFLDDFVV